MAIVEFAGVLHEKFDSEYVGAKKSFQKRFFILEESNPGKDGKVYTELIKFNLVSDQCNEIDKYAIGDRVYIKAKIKGSRWESKTDGRVLWFTELRVLNIYPANDEYGGKEADDDPDSRYINPNDITHEDLLLDLEKKEEVKKPSLFEAADDNNDLPFILVIPIMLAGLTNLLF